MSAIAKRFGPTEALAGVDFEVRPGEILALVGENGAGKSTLMRVLSGAIVPDAGSMTLAGAPYAPRSPAEAHARGVAMIYQELSLAPHLSVAENIVLGREPSRGPLLDFAAARSAARSALEAVGHADIPLDAPVRGLSAARRQIVEIARALSFDARVLVLDEPTTSLGPADVARLLDLLRALRARGIAIVYISHVLEEVLALADRYLVLRDGRSVAAGAVAGVDANALVAHMVGREVNELYPRSHRTRGALLLAADGLELHRGEVLGIAGLVGAGRTELLRAVFGLDPAVPHGLRVFSIPGPATPRTRWSQGVGFVAEDRQREGLALSLSVADNLMLPSLHEVAPWRVDDAARPWLERLGIRCASPREPIARLSGGNQQKVAFARLLAAGCDLLLLDEPTRGIDVGAKARIYELIDELARGDAASGRASCAILLVSSYLPELLGLSDRIAVMHKGRLGPARPARELDAHAILLEAATGERAA